MNASEKNASNVLHEYLGFDLRQSLIYFALLIGVFVVVTGIYVAINGMNSWKTNMQQAGNLMVSNFAPPPPQAGANAQLVARP